jgi:hypothetical protein
MGDERLSIVPLKETASGYNVIVLERIVEGETPDYCVHGRATCMGNCGEWVWLGSETVKVVQKGDHMPLCRECAAVMLPVGKQMPIGHIDDHRRADGPHG